MQRTPCASTFRRGWKIRPATFASGRLEGKREEMGQREASQKGKRFTDLLSPPQLEKCICWGEEEGSSRK